MGLLTGLCNNPLLGNLLVTDPRFRSPPLEIINDGPSLFQDNTVNGTFRYEIMDFYTLYNGKCKGIRIIDPVPIRVAFKFYIGPKPVTIFLLRDLTEVLNLVGQTFFPDANLFKIDENAILQMEKESYAFKSIESRPCQEVMFEDFGQCVMDGLEDVLINRGVECAPPHLEPLLPKFKGKNCSDPDEIKNIMLMASKELSSISIGKSDIKCAFPCTLDYIKATKVDFSVEDPNTADSFLFLPRFSNGYVKTTSEYFIYTPFTILTATGGAMGMFLGWSVYQNHKVLLNIIEMVVIKLCKRRM